LFNCSRCELLCIRVNTRPSPPAALFGHPFSLRFFTPVFVATKSWFLCHFSCLCTYITALLLDIWRVYTRLTRVQKHRFWGFFQKPHYDQMSESFDRLHIEKPEGRN
jgi:hypothetical protein